MTRIAIHGFGRIGRATLRAALRDAGFTPVAISDVKELATLAALFAVDINYGRWPEVVRVDASVMRIGDRIVPYHNVANRLPGWGALGIDLVIDCIGRATTRAGAQHHLDRGAKRVLISGASKTLQDADAVLLPGINLEQFDPAKHKIISMGSCTTNALAPDRKDRPPAAHPGARRHAAHRRRLVRQRARLRNPTSPSCACVGIKEHIAVDIHIG